MSTGLPIALARMNGNLTQVASVCVHVHVCVLCVCMLACAVVYVQ